MAKSKKDFKNNGPVGLSLFLSYIGATVYFVNHADGFWNIIVALLKGAVWPAIIIYNVLQGYSA